MLCYLSMRWWNLTSSSADIGSISDGVRKDILVLLHYFEEFVTPKLFANVSNRYIGYLP
jgi:hypothetical protein